MDTPPPSASVVNAFLRKYRRDEAAGPVPDVSHYQRCWPEHAELIAREYAMLAGAGKRTPPERRIGPWRLIAELGRGGQGVVYVAEDLRLRRRVALKVLGSLAVEGPALERFRREATAAARLDLDGICTVYEAGVHEGVAWIAMQLVEGVSLAALIDGPDRAPAVSGRIPEAAGRLDPRTREGVGAVMDLMARVARILQRAHDAGVFHRDIKPGNIQVDMEGKPVLLDFGVAHLEDRGLEPVTVTRPPGTLAYMAPEQVRNGRGAGIPTEVWAFGVTLYEVLAGQRPFEGPSEHALGTAICQEPHVPIRRRNPLVSKDLAAVVDVALSKEPHDRYAALSDLAADLDRCVRGLPVTVRRPPLLARARAIARRNPLLIAATGPAALVAGLLLAWMAWRIRTIGEGHRLESNRRVLQIEEPRLREQLDPSESARRIARAAEELAGDRQGLEQALDESGMLVRRACFEPAAEIASAVLETDPPADLSARALLVLARAAAWRHDLDAALGQISRAERLAPRDPEIAACATILRLLAPARQLPSEIDALCVVRGEDAATEALVTFRAHGDGAPALDVWRATPSGPRRSSFALDLPLGLTAASHRHAMLATAVRRDGCRVVMLGVRLDAGIPSLPESEAEAAVVAWEWPAIERTPAKRVIHRGFRSSIRSVVPWDPEGDGSEGLAVIHGASWRHLEYVEKWDDPGGGRRELLPEPGVDDDLAGVFRHDADGDGGDELLVLARGHQTCGLYEFDREGIRSRRVLGPLNGFVPWGDAWLVAKSFTPRRHDLVELPAYRRHRAAALHPLQPGSWDLGDPLWQVPEEMGRYPLLSELAVGRGGRGSPVLATALRCCQEQGGSRFERRTFVLLAGPPGPERSRTSASGAGAFVGLLLPHPLAQLNRFDFADLDQDGDSELIMALRGRPGVIYGLTRGPALKPFAPEREPEVAVPVARDVPDDVSWAPLLHEGFEGPGHAFTSEGRIGEDPFGNRGERHGVGQFLVLEGAICGRVPAERIPAHAASRCELVIDRSRPLRLRFRIYVDRLDFHMGFRIALRDRDGSEVFAWHLSHVRDWTNFEGDVYLVSLRCAVATSLNWHEFPTDRWVDVTMLAMPDAQVFSWCEWAGGPGRQAEQRIVGAPASELAGSMRPPDAVRSCRLALELIGATPEPVPATHQRGGTVLIDAIRLDAGR